MCVCVCVRVRVYQGKEEQGRVPEAKWDRRTASSNQIVLLIGDTATGGAGMSETPVIVSSSQTSDLKGERKRTRWAFFFARLSYRHLQRYLIPARPSFYDALSVYPQMPLTSRRFQGRRRSIPIFPKTVGIKGASGGTFVAERPLGVACKRCFTFWFDFFFLFIFGANAASKAQFGHVRRRGDLGS